MEKRLAGEQAAVRPCGDRGCGSRLLVEEARTGRQGGGRLNQNSEGEQSLDAAASSLVAKLLNRFKWIGWIGLAIIVYVALDMVVNGSEQLMAAYHIAGA